MRGECKIIALQIHIRFCRNSEYPFSSVADTGWATCVERERSCLTRLLPRRGNIHQQHPPPPRSLNVIKSAAGTNVYVRQRRLFARGEMRLWPTVHKCGAHSRIATKPARRAACSFAKNKTTSSGRWWPIVVHLRDLQTQS